MHLSDVEHKSVYRTGHTKMSVFFANVLVIIAPATMKPYQNIERLAT